MPVGFVPMVMAYAVVTLAIYVLGPVNWSYDNLIQSVSLVVVSWSLFSMAVLRFSNVAGEKATPFEYSDIFFDRLANTALACAIVVVPATVYVMTGKSVLDASLIFGNQGRNFSEFQAFVSESQGGLLNSLILVIRAGLSWPVLMLFVFIPRYWRGSSKATRLKCLVVVVLWALISVSRGTDKQIVDIFVLMVGGYYSGLCWRGRNVRRAKRSSSFRNRNRLLVMAAVLVVLIALVSVFAERRVQRYDGNLPSCFTYLKICFKDEGFWSAFPSGVKAAAGFGTTYLTQGYDGLGKSFDENWSSTFLFGQSPVLMSLADNYLGSNLYVNSYNFKMRNYWDDRTLWSSMFTWIGNNFSLYSTPFILMFFGIYAGILLRKIKKNGSHVCSYSFCFIILMIIYSPANYQLGVSLDMYISWLVSICFVIRNKFPKFLIKKAGRR